MDIKIYRKPFNCKILVQLFLIVVVVARLLTDRFISMSPALGTRTNSTLRLAWKGDQPLFWSPTLWDHLLFIPKTKRAPRSGEVPPISRHLKKNPPKYPCFKQLHFLHAFSRRGHVGAHLPEGFIIIYFIKFYFKSLWHINNFDIF